MHEGQETICVIGLGYVGLPLAVAFAKAGLDVIGHDLDRARIGELRQGHDRTGEVEDDELAQSGVRFTADAGDIAAASIYIIAVPTPVDAANVPDMGAVLGACRMIGAHLAQGDLVVLESTVYPGVTEELCGPELARASGLGAGRDFHLGYSPERINPGDRQHRLENVVKVVSGQDAATARRVQALYDRVVRAGTHLAPSIRVAEAAKVIENIQRDINIALMNDLAMLFDQLDIPTEEVLRASGSKWNFLPFRPGLVGGHCIGVDPYYLIHRAAQIGYHEQMIGAGRRVNDSVPQYIAQRILALLVRSGRPQARVAVLGMTFKEDVPDIRNSKTVSLVRKLQDMGLATTIHDAHADPEEVMRETGLSLAPLPEAAKADCLVLAVPHRVWMQNDAAALRALIGPHMLVVDIKSALWDLRHLLPDAGAQNYWAF